MKKSLILFACLLGFSVSSQAVLVDLGNGLVADTDQNITWLKDANLIGTACNASSGPYQALWDAYQLQTGGVGQCFAMTGPDATAWIGALNDVSYLGYSDWRLPVVLQPDPLCENQTGGFSSGYNCRTLGSEVAHLMNVTLNVPNRLGTGSTGGPVGIGTFSAFSDNPGPFINIWAASVWTGTDVPTDPARAFIYHTGVNGQFTAYKANPSDAVPWAVRDGLSLPIGDCDADMDVDVDDIICTVNILLAASGLLLGDCDGDGDVDIQDVVCTIDLLTP